MAVGPAIAVVVVAHDSADDLRRALPAVRAQLRSEDELVVVDNASADGSATVADGLGATVVKTGANLGFAGGANVGARATSAPLLMLLNPDAVVGDDCLAALRGAAAEHPAWGAWQALVTTDGGTAINTAGNVVHFLGLGWAGGWGRPLADAPARDVECGFASGAALVVRRDAWEAAGGFDDRYFMYGEDLDLGLRLRLLGWRSGVVPTARSSTTTSSPRATTSGSCCERNRWWTLLGAYPARLLLALAPALLALEVALLAASAIDGWLGAKLRSYGALARELPAILRRRRAIAAASTEGVGALTDVLSADMDSPVLAGAARIPGLVAAQRAYWRAVTALVR